MDFPTVVSAAGLVNNAINALKNARELAKDTADSELKERISDVYDALLDLKERMHAQDDEIRQLKVQLDAKAAYVGPVAPHGYYYFAADAEDEVNPLCPVCFQAKPQQIAFLSKVERYTFGLARKCKLNEKHLIYE